MINPHSVSCHGDRIYVKVVELSEQNFPQLFQWKFFLETNTPVPRERHKQSDFTHSDLKAKELQIIILMSAQESTVIYGRIIQWILVIGTLHCLFSQTYAQHTTYTLSNRFSNSAATTVGDLVLIGGGMYCNDCVFPNVSRDVHIYNATDDTWEITQLSVKTMNLAAATAGNLALFAGGTNGTISTSVYNTVDIYNPTTGTWRTATLSYGRQMLVGASVGNFALFAGGLSYGESIYDIVYYDTVDIFDSSNDTWSTATLSSRAVFNSAFDSNYAVFGSTGAAAVIDVFNKNTKSWTTVTVPEQRAYTALAMAANRIFIAGGSIGGVVSSRVDIYDLSAETWSTATLSVARTRAEGLSVSNSMVMLIGGTNTTNVASSSNRLGSIEVYDTVSDTWAVFSLSQARESFAVTSVGNRAIIAGGMGSSFSASVDTIDIFRVCSFDDECDDGVFCNGAEPCASLMCGDSPGDPCAGGSVCNDQCNEEAKNCHRPFNTSCSDGLFCNGIDYCDNGECIHPGNPCVYRPVCQQSCDEIQDICEFEILGTPCTINAVPGECFSGACVALPTTGTSTSTTSVTTTSVTSTTSVTTSVTSTTSVSTTSVSSTGVVATSTQQSGEAPEHAEASSDDNTIIWAVVGAVGGLLVCSLLVLAIVCIVRRKRSHEPSDANGNQPSVQLIISPSHKESGVELNNVAKVESNNVDKFESNASSNEIKIVRKLGSGNFGDVYLGKWKSTDVAMKQIKLSSETSMEEFEKEFAVLSKLRHPHIVSFLKLHVDKDQNKFLVFEYIPKGSLLDELHYKQGKLTASQKLKMTLDIAKGMEYLEDSKIVHRDLSARNCLVSKVDGKYCIKVSDFGLARITDTGYYKVETSKIPVKWSAPEVFSGLATSKSDVWSFGIVFWEIWTEGLEPYKWLSNKEASTAIPQGERLPRPGNCPDAAWELMQSCWALNPSERPSFSELTEKLSALVEKTSDGEDDSEVKEEKSEHAAPVYQTTPYLETSEVYNA